MKTLKVYKRSGARNSMGRSYDKDDFGWIDDHEGLVILGIIVVLALLFIIGCSL